MLKNYLLSAIRNLKRYKTFSIIKISGLSISMAVVMLIGLWIWDELSFNKYFQNYDRIAQVMQNVNSNGIINTQEFNPIPLGNELRTVYGDDFKYVVMSSGTISFNLTFGEKNIATKGNFFEPEVTRMLTLKMLKGSPGGLKDPSSVLLSESVAKSFFGETDPLNKIIKIDNDQELKVTGVYENLPDKSQFKEMLFIAPWELYIKNESKENKSDWNYNCFKTYVQIADNADMEKISAKIKNIKLNRVSKEEARFQPAMFLHPMYKWHLYSEFESGVNVGGQIQFVWLFGIIGAFVLLLACINFMNLATARSEKRAKEVGIRKAIGSMRGQLINQFFSESILVAFIAFILSPLLVELIVPFFNEITDKKMNILWDNPIFWLLGIGFTLLTGIIAGSYPALYLSSFQPIKVLKGTFRIGRLVSIPRKMLVISQFTVSITIIICVIVVFRQVQFTKDRPVGYSRDNLIILRTSEPNIHNHFDAVRDELKKSGAISDMAESHSPMTDIFLSQSGFDWKGKSPDFHVSLGTIKISVDYGNTVGWQVLEGRDFSRGLSTDSSGMILNEAAVKFMGLKNPIGETIRLDDRTFSVIGIVKDIVMESPYDKVAPSVYMLNKRKGNFAIMKINPEISNSEALSKIEKIISKYNPGTPFDYKFIDEEYGQKFIKEECIGRLSGFFAVLAVFISCLGLFGMASYIAEQRTKEIGVRKILGASIFNLWRLLSKDSLGSVIISSIIASPIAYYFMHGWLQNYAYRTEISLWIFVITGFGVILITLFTVGFQTIKSALADPVKSIKTE